MPVPTSATRYRNQQTRLQYVALAALRREWRTINIEQSWQRQYDEKVGPRLVALVAAAQLNTTQAADAYIPAVLEQVGIDPSGPSVPKKAFAGYAGDGRTVAGLLEGSVAAAGVAYNRGAGAAQALAVGERWLTMAASTVLADTGRAAEKAAVIARPQVAGYVRAISPGACSRCVILAGRYYRTNAGFERHPACNCFHIPVAEDVAGDVMTSPGAYFDSLTEAEQDRVFTKAGAEAIRDGADMNQVVNARRGMAKAQVGGRKLLVTAEGTTRRGVYGRIRKRGPRLMPETIYEIAKNRDDAIRLLRVYGYIAPF